ncbi:MAG: amidohydrolase [Deltaproteobacteria bacterium]|jgi:predicted TIM-barrel fold metal-dependent hydrolase|nr:amidohydrolase [Deltaproteobacteria bacterium]
MPDLGYPVFDADNHFYETEESFTRHLPKKFRKDIQYVEVNGRKKLALCGHYSDYIPNPTFEVVARPGSHEPWFRAQNPEGKTLREITGAPERCRDEYRDPEKRLALMDEQGIQGTVLFPTLASAIEENTSHNHELLYAAMRSFLQWMDETWGFNHADRIWAVPILSLMDVEMACEDLEWCLERGAKTVGIRPAPVPGYRQSRSFGFEEFDPFWARVNEAGIPVMMHASDSGYIRYVNDWTGGKDFLPFDPDPFRSVVMSGRPIYDSVAALIVHGVFRRHPKVRVACIENGCKWVSWLASALKSAYGQMPRSFHEDPLETLRRHIYVSPFYEEDLDELASVVGVERILFGSDFPHPEGLAEPLDFVKELSAFSPADQQKVMSTNLQEMLAPPS